MERRTAILAFVFALTLVCSTVSANAQPSQAKKYIAFRDDDVQPFKWLDALEAVNKVHIEENVPVTLGIIPHPQVASDYELLFYQPVGTVLRLERPASDNELLLDQPFLDYMRSISSNPLFEFAQHGYTHKCNNVTNRLASEFYGRPYEDQYNDIGKGQADIKEAFGVTPTTFVPPWNSGDVNTTKAAAALGFTDYSIGFRPPTRNQYFYVDGMRVEAALPIGSTNDTTFTASIQVAQNETERFLTDPQSGDTLTFQYHMSDFCGANGAVDAHKIQLLMDFIDYLKTQDVLFTRLDRSNNSGGETASSPSSGTTVAAPIITQSGPPIFLLVSSVTVVLLGVHTVALRKRSGRDKPKD